MTKRFYGFEINDSVKESSTAEMLEVFNLIKPKPSAQPLHRIGGNRDGSYLLPNDLTGIVACFSPGVNNFKYFEDALVKQYGIDCHMCDFSSDVEKLATPLIEGRQTFLKKWLSPEGGKDNISLGEWISAMAPSGDLLLQIDIEGAEYLNLLSASVDDLKRFRLIVIEVHSLSAMKNSEILNNVLAPFFRKLGEIFDPVHAHPNNCCGEFEIPGTGVLVPNVLELTYVRKDSNVGNKFLSILPHPQDVSRNVPSKPPIFLNEKWLDGPRSLESKLKLLEDTVEALKEFPNEAHLASVQEIFGRSIRTAQEKLSTRLDPSDTVERELAAGKPFVLSSAYGGRPKVGQVHAKAPFFFHTDIGTNQYIQVDLGSPYKISRVAVENRTDGFFDRAQMIFCIVSLSKSIDEGEVFGFPVTREFATGRLNRVMAAFPATTGRFITVISPLQTALHFSALEVFEAAKSTNQEPIPSAARSRANPVQSE